MRVPSMTWINQYMRAIGLIAAGIVIGSALFMALYQHNFNILYLENQRLITENNELRKELEPLVRKHNNPFTVRQMKVYMQSANSNNPLDDAAASDLRQLLQNDLELLRGRSIDSIAESLVIARGIIRRKIYRLPGAQEYTLDIPFIIVKNSELTIWSEARPYIQTD
jgi:hypothetical protein